MQQELIDLTKKVQTVLDLRKISNIKGPVCLAIDYSGSMSELYRNGTVQNTVNRISAIAVKMDDNEELDVLVFSSGVDEAEPATPAMFGNYVNKEIVNKFNMGGTNYAPFIRKAVAKYFDKKIVTAVEEYVTYVEKAASGVFGALRDALFGKKKEEVVQTRENTQTISSNQSISGKPVLVIVITDGENADQTATTALLEQMQDKNIYWQFVGIGRENFRYLKDIAAKLPNVGFFEIQNLETVKDMELYKQLISDEFAEWAKNK